MDRSERTPGRKRKKELSMGIKLGLGFAELGEKLNGWEEDEIWKANGETKRQEVGGFYRQFRMKMGPGVFSKNRKAAARRNEKRRYRAILGNMEDRVISQSSGGWRLWKGVRKR